MPSYTYEERMRVLAQAREQIEDVERTESVDDMQSSKIFAAGYLAALKAIGAIDTSEVSEFARTIEQAEWDAVERLEDSAER